MPGPAPLPAIVLAAGASTRLGRPKQLLPLPTPPGAIRENAIETLLQHTVRVAQEASFHPIIVILGAHAARIQHEVPLRECMVRMNPQWQEGMASSIRCGVRAVEENCPGAPGVLLLVCDQPMLTRRHLLELLNAHRAAPGNIVASAYAGRPGVPVLAPRSFFPVLLALTGDQGAREVLRAGAANLSLVPFEHGEWDIDRPEDMVPPQRASSPS